MATTDQVEIKYLKIDLNNYRTIKQKDEQNAIHTMISINREWFVALMESLITDGYLPTENIICLRNGKDLIVREGNRRIAAMKILFGEIKHVGFELPSDLIEKTKGLSEEWKNANKKVPCAIYELSEVGTVNKIVRLTHGKGEKAARDKWTSVARARHNRDENKESEPALDLLEKYLRHGENLNEQQRQKWSGDYPLTVLNEAMNKLFSYFGAKTAKDLSTLYPEVKHRKKIEKILFDVGTDALDFKTIRNENEHFGERYGIKVDIKNGKSSKAGEETDGEEKARGQDENQAFSATNPKAVISKLKKFRPIGNNREKLVTLVEEARLLKLKKHPHSFCFLLRSMFEISAKAYCVDHEQSGGPKATKADGNDRHLVDVLRDITNHLTKNNTDKMR